MKLILHDYRRCPFCIRVRIVLHLKQIEYDRISEPLREWTDWMKTQPDPRVPILREITDGGDSSTNSGQVEIIHRESNDINLWLDSNFGNVQFSPEKDSVEYTEMATWWDWCANEFKPMIDLYKYGENREFDAEKNKVHAKKLGEMLQKIENSLENRKYLVGQKLTLADIAIIPFVRQIMRTRNGEFDFSKFPNVINWSNQILDTKWFTDIVMAK